MGPIVSKNVTVDDLTLEQLKGIFGGTIMNCSEVGGDDAKTVVDNLLSDDVQGELVAEQGFIPVSKMAVVKDANGVVTEK